MTWWEGVVLGVVQGLTEFLPVSSSGHLVIAESLLGFAPPGVFFEVAVHVATLFAVVIVYARRLRELLFGIVSDPAARRYVTLLAIASLPLVLGAIFKDFFERVFHSLPLVGVDLLITGCFLWSTRYVRRAERPHPTPGGAFGIGLAQVAAILPGISRSGSTVTAAMWLGVEPVKAAEFSFLMALPAILGAAALQVPDLMRGAPTVGTGPLAFAFVAALIAGIVAIRLLVALLARRAFHRFAPYCWAVGAAALAWSVFGR